MRLFPQVFPRFYIFCLLVLFPRWYKFLNSGEQIELKMNVGLYLRSNKSKSPQRVWAIFRIDNYRFKIDTGRKIEPGNWSMKKQAVLSSHRHSKELNQYLKDYVRDLEKVTLDLQLKKVRLSASKIQEAIDKIYKRDQVKFENGIVDFTSFIDTYIKNKSGVAKTTLTVLKQCRKNIILAFDLVSKKTINEYNAKGSKEKSKIELIPEKVIEFEDVNLDFLNSFNKYLTTAKYKTSVDGEEVCRNYTKNYIAKQVKLCKQYIDAAVVQGYVRGFNHKSVKASPEDVDSIYTNFDEIQSLVNLPLSNNISEERTRDLYVFNCFLGLRYSDLKTLEPHNFKEEKINGEKVIIFEGRAQKTDEKIEFIVHKSAVHILKKYENRLPKMSEQKYNLNLKEIGKKAGFTRMERIRETRGSSKDFFNIPKYKLFSSHTGRRSFCTNYFMEGVPIGAIMSISGHKTEREFLKYINKKARVDIAKVALQVNTIKNLTFS